MSFLQKYGAGLLILSAGVALLLLGVARGELDAVYLKASRICLECIGLG